METEMTSLTVKTLTITAMIAALSNVSYAADAPMNVSADGHSVTVSVDGISKTEGSIMAALFDSSGTFLGKDAYAAMRVEVKGTAVSFTYKGLPSGEYAIALFQDIDGDGQLAKNMLGIPVEPYGFSNNAPVRFGPPKWDTAKFTVSVSTAPQTITLK